MNYKNDALTSVKGQLAAIRGEQAVAEGAIGIDLDSILTRLLDGLINQCFPGSSSMEIADAMVNPSDWQAKAFQRQCFREARREIRRPADKNPTGERLTIRERNDMREEFAEDLYAALRSTAESKGFDGCVELVDELKR